MKVPKATRQKLDRVETRFRGLAFDFATTVEGPGNFEGCIGSGAMELMRKESIERYGETFWEAILLFKLLCHGARVTQHHGENKGEQFKAIAVQFLAVSWLTEALAVPADGSAVDPAVQALREGWSECPVTVAVRFLVQCFLTFDFSKYAVNVTRDAVGWVVPRDAARCWDDATVVVLVDYTQRNVTSNVTAESLDEKRLRLVKYITSYKETHHAVRAAFWNYAHYQDLRMKKRDEYDRSSPGALPPARKTDQLQKPPQPAEPPLPPAGRPSVGADPAPPPPKARGADAAVEQRRQRSPPPPRLPPMEQQPPPPPHPPPPRVNPPPQEEIRRKSHNMMLAERQPVKKDSEISFGSKK